MEQFERGDKQALDLPASALKDKASNIAFLSTDAMIELLGRH